MATLDGVIAEARACRVCADHLPLGPRPVLRAAAGARLMIVGQAPGTKVHASGVPWDDPSGERLRGWMAVDGETFYDAARIAIIPMGFCYPGLAASGGDAPPRPECAPLWHHRLRAGMNFSDTETAAPVRGLRPMRAPRCLTEKAPKPRSSTRSPRDSASPTSSKTVVTILSTSRCVRWLFCSAMRWINSDFVMAPRPQNDA